MIFKKLAIVGIASLGFAGLAQAADIGHTATGGATTATYSATAGDFVVTDFEYTISANVGMASRENTVAFAVGSASSKGRNAYTGSSNGGSVSACGDAASGSNVPTVPTPSLDATDISGCTID